MSVIASLNKFNGIYNYVTIPRKSRENRGNVVLTVAKHGAVPGQIMEHYSETALALESLCEAIDVVATREYPDEFMSKPLLKFNNPINCNISFKS